MDRKESRVQSMGSQTAGRDWATNWTASQCTIFLIHDNFSQKIYKILSNDGYFLITSMLIYYYCLCLLYYFEDFYSFLITD